MKRLAIGAVLTVAVLVCAGAALHALSRDTTPTATYTAVKTQPPTRSELLALVNAERAKYGVAPLKEDKRLDKSAQYKANDEVSYSYYGHISPHDGMHGYEYINTQHITCESDSENLDVNTTATAAVSEWIRSRPHHLAMISPKYTLTGFGIAGQNGQYQLVEHFCQQ